MGRLFSAGCCCLGFEGFGNLECGTLDGGNVLAGEFTFCCLGLTGVNKASIRLGSMSSVLLSEGFSALPIVLNKQIMRKKRATFGVAIPLAIFKLR